MDEGQQATSILVSTDIVVLIDIQIFEVGIQNKEP